jgi:hypothetical protein
MILDNPNAPLFKIDQKFINSKIYSIFSSFISKIYKFIDDTDNKYFSSEYRSFSPRKQYTFNENRQWGGEIFKQSKI